MNKKIIIGSRGSKLALLYAQKAKELIIKNTSLHYNDIFIKPITTKGDQEQNTRLSEILFYKRMFQLLRRLLIL